MTDQAPPPPPVVDQAPPRRRTFLWVGLAVLIAVVSFVIVAGLLVQAMGWRSLYHAERLDVADVDGGRLLLR